MEPSQPNHINNPLPHHPPQNEADSLRDPPDFFRFLKVDEDKHSKSPPFFSKNGLSQDIIHVTDAEPDVCLEVFYALYHVLWPQIEKQSDVSFKDAWTSFIGGSLRKGSLCPPERLITEKKIRVIEENLSEAGGESLIFQDLDGVLNSISHLKQKVVDHSGQISQKEEIVASLSLVCEFYLRYRDKMKALVQDIIENERINASSKKQRGELEDLLEPKAIMMSDSFSQHWAYRIPRGRAQKLLSKDANGRNLKNNSNDPSNHRVIALPEKAAEPLVFFKANGNPPIQPEKEFMLESLYRHLQIPVPETALLILTDVFEKNSEYFYAVQASEAVLGESALKACQDPETILNQDAYVSQVIGALLTNPSDGSFKNFKYSSIYQTLISIDNDLIFKPELTGENDEKIINVKSILYLLAQIDLPFPESRKVFFATLDPHLTVFAWLQDLFKKNQEYNLLWRKLAFQKTRCIYENLLPQSEVPSLVFCLLQEVQVDYELHDESFHPQIFVSTNLLNNFIEKLQMIEKVLLMNRSVSTQALFEEISPSLGKYYRKLRLEFSSLEEALEAVWGAKKNDIDYSYISSLLDPEEFGDLSGNMIESDENLPPETFFKQYKNLLISGSSPLDRFIRRQTERKKKNALSLRAALQELQFLVQEGFTNSQSIREIMDFCHSLSKIIDQNQHLAKEIIFLLSNLPLPELRWLLTLEKYFLRPDRNVPKDLISLPVLGALMKQRTFLLSEPEKNYLFDQQGDLRKNPSLTGRSCVTCFPEKNPEFYLKQYPEWPGYEFASTLFMRLMGVTQLPSQDLILINNNPVLLTQKAPGNLVVHVWDTPKAFHNLDPVHTGLLIISAMLLNPEDGKEDNFILSPDGRYLIPIDNDHCFLPSFSQKEGSFWNAFTVNTALQTKTLLFCLDEMYLTIPLEVQQHFLSINFDERLPQWMAELDKLENQFNNLVDQNQRNTFLERGTVMRIPFYKQFIQNLHWKVHKIRDLLTTKFQPTPFELLEAVEPFAAKCYQDSFKKGSDLQTRFKAATSGLYTITAVNGSRISIINTRDMMEIISVSEQDLQKDVAFQKMGPVDALELLNQLIQERSERAQKEKEMLCELDEKDQEKKFINLFGDSPVETDLKIFFANPKEGLVLKSSRLITSSKLRELFSQTPNRGMMIRFLSLPNSPSLTDKEIRILAAECPNLEYLNVSGCERLKQIFTAERELPLLARLEAKDCFSLEQFVSYSPLKILRIGSERIAGIFVDKSTLDTFAVSNRGISFEFTLKAGGHFQVRSGSQTISHNDFIQNAFEKNDEIDQSFRNLKITLGRYPITSGKDLAVFIREIDLSKSYLWDQRLTKIKLINLRKLNLTQCRISGKESLEYLIQGDWPKLLQLNLSENKIHDEEVQILSRGNWPLLEILDLNETNMTNAGVEILRIQSKWPKLKQLCLAKNMVNDQAFDILSQGGWPLLEIVDLSFTKFTKIGVYSFILNSNLPNLKEVVGYGSVENLRKEYSLMKEFNLSQSAIPQHEIKVLVNRLKLPQLKYLNLSWNLEVNDQVLEILSQGDWPFLETLNLCSTKITFAGVEVIATHSRWPQLKHLDLSHNELGGKGLEVLSKGNWPLLQIIDVRSTQETNNGFLNFKKNTNLSNLKEVRFEWPQWRNTRKR